MKVNRLKLVIKYCLAVFAISILFASCDGFTGSEPSQEIQYRTVLERKDELALLHLADSYDTPVEELESFIEFMLRPDYTQATKSKSAITGVSEFTVTVEDGFSSVTANRRPVAGKASKERSEIPFYVFNLENPAEQKNGFAFACGDPRIGSLLALVEDGDFYETKNPFWSVFLSCLEDYILETIELYNSARDEDIAEAITIRGTENARYTISWSDYNIISTVGPLITTHWGQIEPYNHIINSVAERYDPSNPDNHWVTGCAPVAIAQIMVFHEWPNNPPAQIRNPKTGSYVNSFFDVNASGHPNRTFSSIVYDWANMRKYTDRDEARTQIGVLMLEIGDKVKIKYGTGASSTDPNNVPGAFANMGYHSPSALKSYNFEDIKTSLDAFRPVYIRGDSIKETTFFFFTEYKKGHAWVIDGYRRAKLKSSGDIEDFVWCNPGWNGSNIGWYKSGVFKMNIGPVNWDRSGTANHYQYNVKIIPNITPNGQPPKPFASGSGTVNDPYLIGTYAHLKNLIYFTGSGNYFKLATDITIPDDPSWPTSLAFRGNLNGNGKTITIRQRIYANALYHGLFAENYGTIENLTVQSTLSEYRDATSVIHIGAIAGYNRSSGKIINCTSKGTYSIGCTNPTINTYFNVGGMAGKNEGTIQNCTSQISISTVTGFIGGIAGKHLGGNITGCTFTGVLSHDLSADGAMPGYYTAGQIVGCPVTSGTMNNNHANGTIYGRPNP